MMAVEEAPVSNAPGVNPTSTPLPGATPEGTLVPEPALTPLWEPVDERSVRDLPAYPAEWSTDGRFLVRVSGAATTAQSWRVGDELSLPVPQLGDTFRPLIDEIDDGGGSRAALGRFADINGRPRRVVVTVGPNSMFAYIDTPEGAYELVADNSLGWLLPTASMMAGFDFSKSDYILPAKEGVAGVARAGDAEETETLLSEPPER